MQQGEKNEKNFNVFACNNYDCEHGGLFTAGSEHKRR